MRPGSSCNAVASMHDCDSRCREEVWVTRCSLQYNMYRPQPNKVYVLEQRTSKYI